MSTSTRLTHWLPWGIACICGALALAGWLRPVDSLSSDVSAGPTDPPAAAVDGEPPSDRTQLEALTECTTRLERLRSTLEIEAGLPEVTQTWLGAPDGGVPASVAACLARPGALAIASQVVEERQAERRREEHRAVRRTLSELLAIPPDDIDWMSDYVCEARALRRDSLAELRGAAEPTDELLEPLRTGRLAILDDVRSRIGEERYAAFREIGGVGMLGEVLECDD